jgi:VanZ family protein
MHLSSHDNRLIAWLTFGYFALLIYASLMPYDFDMGIDASREFKNALRNWPVNPYARVSGSDVLSNLLLYIPLSFPATTFLLSRGASRSGAFVISLAGCILTSLSIEILQIFSIFRVASITDLLMNSISGALGSGGGILFGSALWSKVCKEMKMRWQNSPLDLLTLIFAALVAADALAPFMPTLLLSQVWRSLKASVINPWSGFSAHAWHWWLVTHVMVYMVLTLMSMQWHLGRDKRLGALKATFICTLFAIILESAKIFIASRVFNLSNILANIAGIIAALAVVRFRTFTFERRVILDLGSGGIILYLIYLGWTPFNFEFDMNHIRASIPAGAEILPFYHYAMGASLEHVRLFLQTVLLSGALAYLLCMRFGPRAKNWYTFLWVLLLSTSVGVVQEGGQLFLPGRTPSMTDIYSYLLGGLSGRALALKYPLPDRHPGNTASPS